MTRNTGRSPINNLLEGAMRYGCSIHAYVLMTNHVHLLASPEADESLSCVMRYLGSRYAQYVNHVGTLWEGEL